MLGNSEPKNKTKDHFFEDVYEVWPFPRPRIGRSRAAWGFHQVSCFTLFCTALQVPYVSLTQNHHPYRRRLHMKQYQAVIEVMKANGGFATLGHLYSEVPKIRSVEWKTKTPFASIRRIVQDTRFFFKIRPGLWALKDSKQKLPESMVPTAKESKKPEFTHSYYQGLLVEIGNLRGYDTFVPSQDKTRTRRSSRSLFQNMLQLKRSIHSPMIIL